MICPNLSDSKIKSEFDEIKSVIGENAAYAVWSQNQGNNIETAPNKAVSILFKDLLDNYKGDRSRAIHARSITFSNGFKSAITDKILDKNGEPQMEDVLNYIRITKRHSYVPERILKVYSDIIQSINRRINDIEHSKFRNNKKTDELKSLLFTLDKLEDDQATMEFVDYMVTDVDSALNDINRLQQRLRNYRKTGVPHEITADELFLIKTAYIGFYNKIAENITNMLEDESTFDYIKNEELIETTRLTLQDAIGKYNELVRIYNNVEDFIAKENFINEATKAGSYTVDKLKSILDDGDMDISTFGLWLGSSQYSSSEVVRLIMNKVINTKNSVHEQQLQKGKEILALLSKVDKSKVALFHERDRKGNKTGFMTRDLNYGQHYQDYLDFLRRLADDMGFKDKDVNDVPMLLNKAQLTKWNSAINKYDANHSIRKFIPEYYEITNSLSEEARAKRDEINTEIGLLLSRVVEEDGRPHKEKLTDEDYAKLQALELRRRNLANPFYSDGTVKTGIDKHVAKEMQAYNNKLKDKLQYTYDEAAFKSEMRKAKKELTPEEFKKWKERNTVERIKPEFWEDIKKLSSGLPKTEAQERYEETRRNLIKLYTMEDGKIDTDSMPDKVRDMINTYDQLISQESYLMKVANPGTKSTIEEISTWKVNPKYYDEFDAALAKGQAATNVFLSMNATQNYDGSYSPASFWKKLVPKKEMEDKYIEVVPNRSWYEIDKESPWYDKRFIKYADRGESRIPNPEMYSNKTNFDKINADSNLKNLYNKLVETMAEANSNIKFQRYANNYKLPQIEGGTMTQILGKSSVLKGLKYAFTELYTAKADDPRYRLDQARRSDGTVVKLIPTRYMRMLEDPNTLTNDIVGSIIEYYGMATNYAEMSQVAPELEVALSFISKKDYTNDKGNLVVGKESNTYKKLSEIVDRLVYGMERDALEYEMSVPFKKDEKVKISVDKIVRSIANYTRIQGISQNIDVILTGLITNKMQNRLEAISGIYFDNKALHSASKIVASSYAKVMANLGNANNKDKILCYLEYMGSVRENEQTFGKLNQSRVLRTINQHFWYFGHSMTDYATKGKMAVAIALYYKYDPKSGKFVNKNEFLRTYKDKKKGKADWNNLSVTFYDAFDVKENMLTIKDEYKKAVDDKLINKIRNTTKQVGTRIDTQLTDLDKAHIHYTIGGSLVMIYRNFILQNLQTKFITKRHFNYSTGMWNEAQIRAGFNYVQRHYFNKNKIDELKRLYKDHYDEMDDFEKGCLKRVTYEFLFATIGFMIASMVTRALSDEYDNWWTNEAAYLAVRAGLETRGNIVPLETANLISSPTAAWGTLAYFGELATIFIRDPFEEIHKGPYRGMNRFQRSLIKTTPFRSLWEAQDPENKMNYYENMISIINF